MHAISDNAVSQQSLVASSIATYRAGETVLSAASTSGRLLILKEGAVTVVKEGVEIAKVTEPGAAFGELSAWLGQPHTAEVVALEESLGASGGNLAYAGYPYDPFVDTVKH